MDRVSAAHQENGDHGLDQTQRSVVAEVQLGFQVAVQLNKKPATTTVVITGKAHTYKIPPRARTGEVRVATLKEEVGEHY